MPPLPDEVQKMQTELNELRVSVSSIANLCALNDARAVSQRLNLGVSTSAVRELLPAWAVASAYTPPARYDEHEKRGEAGL